MQEPAHSTIKTDAKIVIGWQSALGVQANLIERPPEENEATDLLGGMSETGNFHGVDIMVLPTSEQASRGMNNREA